MPSKRELNRGSLSVLFFDTLLPFYLAGVYLVGPDKGSVIGVIYTSRGISSVEIAAADLQGMDALPRAKLGASRE